MLAHIILNHPGQSSSTSRPPTEVAAGLIFRHRKLLITQRYPDAHLGGLWEFPGGKVEPGESFEACLQRELEEELGVMVSVGSCIFVVTHSYPEKTILIKFFSCSLVQNEPMPLGCHNLAWVTQEELRQFDFPAADVQLLKKLESSAEFWVSD